MNIDNYIEEQAVISQKNKIKVQEAVDKYHNAKVFPRKKKKLVKKQALRDYRFWVAIDKWHSELNKILCVIHSCHNNKTQLIRSTMIPERGEMPQTFKIIG